MPKHIVRIFTKKLFIVVNVLLSLCFLIGCYGYLFNPTYFWFTGFLTLGVLYLLALLFVCIIFWLFVKAKFTLISIVPMALALVPLRQIIPFTLSTSYTIAKDSTALRIMSWNVEHFDILQHKTHPEVKQQMLDLISSQQPDIACFQEMVGSDSIKKAINYIPTMMKQIGFDYYYYTYNRKSDFDGNHHFGIIIFSKFPIINKQTVSNYPNDYNSIFQYIDVVKQNDTIRIFNTHLQSLKFSNSNLNYINQPSINQEKDFEQSKSLISKFKVGFLKRKLQAEKIKDEIIKSPYPAIVCGDFNDVPNSYAYHTIGSNLNNAFAKKGFGIGRTFSGISPTLRIDNIFCDKKFNILQYTCINKKLSDHFPILADVQLNPQ
jgi:endonuclease/exonuclease/phosphatase family metal-dependent hydrolase